MSNSSLVGYIKISPNKTVPRDHAIDRITPHCYVAQATAPEMAAWLCNPDARASSNYGIAKDGVVAMFVEEKDRSWCSSNRANDMRAITIECASDRTHPYAINNVVYDKLLDLMTDICQRYGKKKLLWFGDKDKTLNYSPKTDEMIITVHRWFDNRECPGDYIYSRLPKIAEEVTRRLQGGKLYRVRLAWDKEDTQKGAFYELENAIVCADSHPGYSVFDHEGVAVYTSAKEQGKYTPDEWIAVIAPIAQELAKKYVILPSVVIAQTALETGWGSTDLTGKHNIVGMKADLINNTWDEYSTWDGIIYEKVTPEYYDGALIYIKDVFRVYKSFRQCLEDYENFLLHVQNNKGYKYRRLQGVTDPKKVINIVRIGTGTNSKPEGYCTDPAYESKILSIIDKYNLTQYDDVMPKGPDGHKIYYRVQAGAYEKKKNAQNQIKNIKKLTGFDSFVEYDGLYKVYCGSFDQKKNAEERIKALENDGISAFIVKLKI